MSESPNQNGNEENGDVPEIELIIKVSLGLLFEKLSGWVLN